MLTVFDRSAEVHWVEHELPDSPAKDSTCSGTSVADSSPRSRWAAGSALPRTTRAGACGSQTWGIGMGTRARRHRARRPPRSRPSHWPRRHDRRPAAGSRRGDGVLLYGQARIIGYAVGVAAAYAGALFAVSAVLQCGEDMNKSRTLHRLAVALPLAECVAAIGGREAAAALNYQRSTATYAAVLAIITVIFALAIVTARATAIRMSPAAASNH